MKLRALHTKVMKIFGVFCIVFCVGAGNVFALSTLEVPMVRKVQLDKKTSVLILKDSMGKVTPDIFPGIENLPQKLALISGSKSINVCNTFLIKINGQNVLVDAGRGEHGPRTGVTMQLLKAQRINPKSIKNILLTHMHPDHISGLLNSNGSAAFPNATLHVSHQEYNYWMLEATKLPTPTELQRKVIDVYTGKLKLFEFNAEVLPGIRADSAVGHTPGHTIFTITGDGKSLTIIADTLHAAALQLSFPSSSAKYDLSPIAAATTRRDLLEALSRSKSIVVGSHIVEIGTVRRNSTADGYEIIPLKD